MLYLISFAGILMSLLLVLSTNDQIIRVYYIGMLLVDLTIVLYFNILNTLSIYSEAVNSGSLYDVSNAAIIIPTVGLSWLFFLFAIMLYAKAFSSLKPAILSLLFIPVIIQNSLTSEIDKPPLIICFCRDTKRQASLVPLRGMMVVPLSVHCLLLFLHRLLLLSLPLLPLRIPCALSRNSCFLTFLVHSLMQPLVS